MWISLRSESSPLPLKQTIYLVESLKWLSGADMSFGMALIDLLKILSVKMECVNANAHTRGPHVKR